ncbi:venom allergen 5-like [Parasteatoda tepidariorum]|uniref:venom allergen 5-like n=1 Tax=Parasteatoda tepidariorum TaxID=114398 RepID=UPI0039BCBC6E
MAWAHTYKVGCGYVSFRPAQGISQQIYVCNYSPAPEHLYPRLYKPGTPCTECPVNSCCDTDPTEPGTYAGLCRLYFAPAIYLPMAPLRFYCSFIDEDPNCNFKNRGQTPYKLIKIPGGNLLLTEMGMGTPPASAWFPRTIIGKSGACLVIVERNAQSADLGVQQREKSKLQVILHIHEADRTYPQIIVLHLQNSWVFMTHHVPLTFDRFFTIELLMTPRSDGLPLFIEIKEMMVNDIPCQYG